MRRSLIVIATAALLPVVSSGGASANGAGPTFTPASASFVDTAAWDSYADIVGTIDGQGGTPTLVDGVDAVNPPDTYDFRYTKMKVGSYGTMFFGADNRDNSSVFSYIVDRDAANALAAGAASDPFTFESNGSQAVFTVYLTGVDDTPTISPVLEDFTDGITADALRPIRDVAENEGPIKAFDGSTATKTLWESASFYVDVEDPHVLTAIGLTTAGDYPERDPVKLSVWGSNVDVLTPGYGTVGVTTRLINNQTIAPPSGRGADYPNIAVSSPDAYSYYQLRFEPAIDGARRQISEIRLSGYPESLAPRYRPGDPATTFSGAVTLYDDNTTTLTATLSENTLAGDVLGCAACAENSITATWASPTLTLTAAAGVTPTRANWQAAARSLTFLRPDAKGTTGPTVALSLSDGGSTPGTTEIDIEILRLAPSIAVPATSLTATVGAAIEPFRPNNTGDEASWTISPALPAGLSLDADTGEITGTPTAIAAATEYTLTAANTGGSDTETFTLTVADLPAAPTSLTAAPGDRSATITFTAGGDGGSPITNYEYTTDGGTTWTALIPADTESPITVRGLTNDTASSIAIRAVNAVGSGAASESVSVTPSLSAATAVPVRDASGEIPQVTDATKGIVLIDGVRSEVAVVADEKSLVMKGDGFEISLSGASSSVGEDGRLRAASGGSVTVAAAGFAPGSTVEVVVMSEPQYLGSALVGADGSFSESFPLPEGLPFGDHTVQVNGVTSSGAVLSLNLGIKVAAAGELPSTGADTGPLLALLTVTVGLLTLISTRRNRPTA